MSQKHTPGPWYIWKEKALQAELAAEGATDQEFVTEELLEYEEHEIFAGEPVEIDCSRIKGYKAKITVVEDDDFGAEETLANARLIAAAPDLLEALQALDTLFAPIAKDTTAAQWIDKARAAIAKATGGAI